MLLVDQHTHSSWPHDSSIVMYCMHPVVSNPMSYVGVQHAVLRCSHREDHCRTAHRLVMCMTVSLSTCSFPGATCRCLHILRYLQHAPDRPSPSGGAPQLQQHHARERPRHYILERMRGHQQECSISHHPVGQPRGCVDTAWRCNENKQCTAAMTTAWNVGALAHTCIRWGACVHVCACACEHI